MKTLAFLKNKIKETETYQRVTADTPDYHKGLIKIGLGTAGAGVLIKIAMVFFPATLPVGLASIATDLITAGLTMAGVSKTVKKDK